VSGLLVVPALGLTISGTGRRLMEGLLLLLVENDPLPEPRKNYSFKFQKIYDQVFREQEGIT
jgi:hypothetical protein